MAENEYIERDRIVKFIENGLNDPDKTKAFGHDAVEILAEIHLAPAADVAPVVRGEWIVSIEYKTNLFKSHIRKEKVYVCPYCGRVYRKYMNFCGNCGARLNEGENNG